METTRQQKIARMLQKDLGIIFQQESRNLFEGAMITVTKVQIAKDLSFAKIFLSLFLTNNKPELLDKIRHHGREIRHQLAGRIHQQLRVIPELVFYEDDSLDYIENIDQLLK